MASSELEHLRAQKISHEKPFKRLTQELNVKDYQMQQINEKRCHPVKK